RKPFGRWIQAHASASGAPLPLPGGERVGVRGQGSMSVERSEDGVENALGIAQDIIVPESQHAVTERFENSGGLEIRLGAFGVLPSVKLDDKARVGADEVDDVAVNGCLAPELPAAESSVPQLEPEHALRVGLVAAQASGSSGVPLHRSL